MGGSSIGFPLATSFGGQVTQLGPQESALGVDIYFGEQGMLVSSTQDWSRVSGATSLRLYLYRRLITSPGDIKARPRWGCGLRRALRKPFTSALRAELIARMTEQLPDDPRVRRLLEAGLERDTYQGVPIFRAPVIVESIGDTVAYEPLISDRKVA